MSHDRLIPSKPVWIPASLEFKDLQRNPAVVFSIRNSFLKMRAEAGSGESFDGRVLAARCVASFDIGLSLDLLEEIATSDLVYWDDRLSAAKELNELGASGQALDALRDITFESDEFQGRFDAAVTALEMTDDEKDRARLYEVIEEHKPDDVAYDDTLGRASVLGFAEFAIPLLRASIEEVFAAASEVKAIYRLGIGSALWGCETLASIGSEVDAQEYYKRLLILENLDSREIAEILSSMKKAGFRDQVESLLREPETLAKLRVEPDWFTSELLAQFGLSRLSTEDTLASLQAGIRKRTKLHDCLGYAESLISEGRKNDVLEAVKAIPPHKLMPGHFEILSRCGEREAAKERLRKGVRSWGTREQIWAGKVLERIGFTQAAKDKLLELSQSSDLSLEDRMDSALEAYQIDEGDLSVVEGSMQQATGDELLLARLAKKLVRHGGDVSVLAWECIIKEFARDDLADEHRFEYVCVLQHSSAPVGFEQEEEDLNDEIIGLLAGVSNPWLFARCTSQFSSNYANGYFNSIIVGRQEAEPALWSAELLNRIALIKEINVPIEDKIIEFSMSEHCDWQTGIHALLELAEGGNSEAAEAQLREIAIDREVPAKWRLLALGVKWNQRRSDDLELYSEAFRSEKKKPKSVDRNNLIQAFCIDPTLSAECRLAAITCKQEYGVKLSERIVHGALWKGL